MQVRVPFISALFVVVKKPYTSTPVFVASNLDKLLLLNLMNPSVSGLFINTLCDPETSACVIPNFLINLLFHRLIEFLVCYFLNPSLNSFPPLCLHF